MRRIPILLLLGVVATVHGYDSAIGFDVATGVPMCSASRGKLMPSLELALTSCKHTDDCDHGTRCVPCRMRADNDCDVDGMTAVCRYASMCDITTDTTKKTRKWNLRRNIIETDHPTSAVENPANIYD